MKLVNTLLMTVAVGFYACGNSKNKDDQNPAPTAPTAQQIEAGKKETAQAPKTVYAMVPMSADNQPDFSKAEYRTNVDEKKLANLNADASAWTQNGEVMAMKDVSKAELDRSSSTSSFYGPNFGSTGFSYSSAFSSSYSQSVSWNVNSQFNDCGYGSWCNVPRQQFPIYSCGAPVWRAPSCGGFYGNGCGGGYHPHATFFPRWSTGTLLPRGRFGTAFPRASLWRYGY